jgi:hypothetical protein
MSLSEKRKRRKDVAGTVFIGGPTVRSRYFWPSEEAPFDTLIETTDETMDDSNIFAPFGNADGSVTVTVTGGTAPYTVELVTINTDVGSGPFVFPNLSGGDFTVIVTDADMNTVEYPVHVYREAYEAGVIKAANIQVRPSDTEQSAALTGIEKFDASLGTLAGVVFGYSDGVFYDTNFFFDPDIVTTNTAGITRTIRTEHAQLADFSWNAVSLKALDAANSATNTIVAGFFALTNTSNNIILTPGEIAEMTDAPTLSAVTGTGDVSGLTLDLDPSTVTLVVTSGGASPDPTWLYAANRPQVTGFLYVRYRYTVPRQ